MSIKISIKTFGSEKRKKILHILKWRERVLKEVQRYKNRVVFGNSFSREAIFVQTQSRHW